MKSALGIGLDVEEVTKEIGEVTKSKPDGVEAPSSDKSLPGPIELLKESWDDLRGRWRTLLGVTVISYVILVVAWIALFAISAGVFTLGLFAILVPVLLFPALLLLQSWFVGSVLITVIKAAGVKDSLKNSIAATLSVFWLTVLYMSIIMGGFILLIIPGIILSVWFVFSLYVLIDTGERGMVALIKSRELVRGSWWGVVGRLSFFFLVYILLFIPVAFMGEDSLIASGYQLLLTAILIPLSIVSTFTLYKYLKVKRGAFDLTIDTKRKWKYGWFGLVGIVLLVLGVGSSLLLVALNPVGRLKGAREAPEKANQLQNVDGESLPNFDAAEPLNIEGKVSALSQARDAQRTSSLLQIQSGLEIYKLEKGSYPNDLVDLVPVYLQSEQKDPETGDVFVYTYDGDADNYTICLDYETRGKECVEGISVSSFGLDSPQVPS